MQIHVFIATTQGPIAVQRVVAEEPDVQSVVCVDGGMEPLPISQRYHDFVRKGTGLIQRDFGEPAYRMDVSSRIDQGNSWQLPTYLAHFLNAEGLLGNGSPQPGDKVIWATGALKADKRILSVEEVFNKLVASRELFTSLQQLGVECLILVPAADDDALHRWLKDCEFQPHSVPVLTLEDAIDSVRGFVFAEAPTQITEPGKLQEPYLPPPDMVSERVKAVDPITAPTQGGERPGSNRWLWGVLLLALAVGGGYGGWIALSEALPEPVMVVEKAAPGTTCQETRRIIEQQLLSTDRRFPAVALNGLCGLWLEAPPEIVSVVGMALDNGALLPINKVAGRWQVALPEQRYRTREYALLVSSSPIPASTAEAITQGFVTLREQGQKLTVNTLSDFAKDLDIPAEVYRHKLTYRKMSADDF
ncbi:MAG: hypothetical protein SV765_08980 [Pseudomonadota bacterium]|nr:hypothetical protein [Pseudomonadota bacterium]